MSSINKNKLLVAALATGLLAIASSAQAGVSASDAAKLKSGELTPFGAEKAGNKDGSIPAWDGGYKGDTGGHGGARKDPFAGEKPLVTITAANMAQYADKLTDGVQALLKKYPDYHVNVYPTHRTASAPQWVYDNTFKNATNGHINGITPKGVYGGIPFPIPKTGEEVMWNHLMRWPGESMSVDQDWFQITKDGKPVLISSNHLDQQWPYFQKDGNAEQFEKSDGTYWMVKIRTSAPALRAGEALLAHENVNADNLQTWVYLTGQRRTRKLPNACCDAPTPAAAGVMSFDEIYTFTGRLDRFDWKIVGKKEMYIPYNENGWLDLKDDTKLLSAHGYNPDAMRWELHRVWVVEANLKAGQRHQAPHSRYYCDEDSWICVLGDRWDAKGQLWKTLWAQTFVASDLPGVMIGANGFNDLLSGAAFVGQLPKNYKFLPKRADSYFSDSALAGDSAR